jgi:hypothetical protein
MSKPDFRWPTCEEAESGGTRLVPTEERYELCLDGYSDIGSGPVVTRADYKQAVNLSKWLNIRDGRYLKWTYPVYLSSANHDYDGYGAMNKLCGRGSSGSVDIAKQYADKEGEVKYRTYDNVPIFDEITIAKRIYAAIVVDVYIDGKLYKRVPLNY